MVNAAAEDHLLELFEVSLVTRLCLCLHLTQTPPSPPLYSQPVKPNLRVTTAFAGESEI